MKSDNICRRFGCNNKKRETSHYCSYECNVNAFVPKDPRYTNKSIIELLNQGISE